MRLIEVECTEITLTGITLNSTFTIKNPHQILAVMFQFESRPHYFEIEPLRGMVMQGQKKVIKIRLKPQYRNQAEKIESRENIAFIRATYYCQYNKKLLEANKIRGWSTISKQFQQTNIPIKLCFEAEVQRLKQSYRNGSSLKNSRKQNSFEKFRDSSVKRVKNSKLNEDLDFLFRNEEYARLKSQQKSNQPKELRQLDKNQLRSVDYVPQRNYQTIQSSNYKQRVLQQKKDQNKVSLPAKGYQPSPFVSAPKKRNNRGFQLVILAIVAALFLAIGEGLGSVFKEN